MSKYLLIESRDPFESNEVSYLYSLASGLRKEGHEVTLFLVQNGVLPARKNPKGALSELAKAGIQVMADDFSLHERGIAPETLAPGIQSSPIDRVVDLLADSQTKAIWH